MFSISQAEVVRSTSVRDIPPPALPAVSRTSSALFLSLVKQRKGSNFWVSLNTVLAAAFLVYWCSSPEDFFPRFAVSHSHVLPASPQSFSDLCIHITTGKALLEDFLYFLFCFITIFINMHIQWKAGARFCLCIVSSHELHDSQKVLQTEFIFMCVSGFTVSLLGCHVENLPCFIPWKIWLLVAFKFCP